MENYIDSQTYVSNTIKILDLMDVFASSTQDTNKVVTSLINNQNEVSSILKDIVNVQQLTIVGLMLLSLALAFYIIRQPIINVTSRFASWVGGYFQEIRSWSKRDKLIIIIFPIIIIPIGSVIGAVVLRKLGIF